MIKKSLASCFLLGVVVLAIASSGGEKNKKKSSLNTSFSPSSFTGFSLKSGPQYSGSLGFTTKNRDFVLHNSVMAFQKGNTIYILPYKYKTSTHKQQFKTNLEAVDLKINLHK